MKKTICLLLALCTVFALAACGGSAEAPAPENAGWTREGYFQDEKGCFASVVWMDDVDEPGWYVGFMNGEDYIEDSYGGMLPQEGNSLHGSLDSSGGMPALTVTVTEEGDGLQIAVEGGESYHLTPVEMEKASIFVSVNVEGWGNIDYAAGETAPEIDPEYPFQSAQINLAAPAVHTFVAWPKAGNVFVKWTKNGEDFSTDAQITVTLDESADFVAVFEEDPDWQNPVMNFVGEYQSDRAHALVECFDADSALITIEWGGSAWELARWTIIGRLNLDTLTISYSNCTKAIVTSGDDGENEEIEYDDGTGTIVFGEGLSFTWHEDRSEREDMVFVWKSVEEADPGYYSAVTSMEKNEVEEFCSVLRDAYLEEDWETLARYVRYPITINNKELKNAHEFESFMKDRTVSESDREALADESCRDMFFNGQGICLGAGELWVVDLSYMTEETPNMVVIGINGIVEK